MNIPNILKEWYKINQPDKNILSYINSKLIEHQQENNHLANTFFVYKEIYQSHLNYVTTFNLLKKHDFYNAWCLLETIEIALVTIKDNIEYIDNAGEFGIDFLTNMVRNWQALFPYKIFFSSRELIKELKCSICNQKRHLINDCGHVKGRVYNGVLCVDIVVDFEIITYDIVSNPVNKYSVPFSSDGDNHSYSELKFVLNYIKSEHQIFFVKKGMLKYKNHNGVSSPTYRCPCNSSFKSYEECCLSKKYLYIPHIAIDFPLPLNVDPFFNFGNNHNP